MKKIIAVVSATAILLTAGSGTVTERIPSLFQSGISASAEVSGTFTYYLTEDDKATITGYTGNDAVLDIPSTIDGYPVTAIGVNAFMNNFSLETVTVPEGVTDIAGSAFYNCTALKTISLPASLASTGNASFSAGTDFTAFSLAEGSTAFTVIDGILYNKDVTTLICCPAGKATAVIPDSVTAIGDVAFGGCENLTEVIIPDKVVSIGMYSFCNCTGLLTVEIPSNVVNIGWFAYFGCTGLTSLTLEEGVSTIGSDAFTTCDSLKNIVIPASISWIADYAFGFADYAHTTKYSDIALLTYPGTAGAVYAEKFAIPTTSVYKDISETEATLSQTAYAYDGAAKEPTVAISGLTQGAHYTVSYENNTAAGTAKAIINGIGYYNGSLEIPFTISKANLTGITVTGSTAVYDGKTHSVTAKIPTGSAISYSTDGGKTYTAVKPSFTKAGSYTVKYKVTESNYNDVTGSVIVKITAKSISTATVSGIAASYTYTGSALKPAVTVKNGTTALKSGTDYTMTYTSNTGIGKATVTITGKGNYSGSVTKSFKINPKATGVTLTAAAKKITVKFTKVSGVTGYEIYRATSKTGTYTKIKTTTAASYTNTGLTKGKTYYYKVRTYKTVSGVKYYTDSAVKSAKSK
ncbi:MAG: leucine-rich repeat domain-containing protein [Oscillospiraceae bacterium]